MRLIRLTAAVAFCALSSQANAQAANSTPAAPAAPAAQPAPAAAPAAQPAAPAAQPAPAAAPAAPAAKPATFQLNETTWTFTDKDGTKVKESIDAKGNYIAQNAVDGKHLDHGVSLMKGDRACFTSAMTKAGEVCWTTKPLEIGQSFDTTSDKGEKLTVSRIAYTPLSMPK
jgi:hypothetical protein